MVASWELVLRQGFLPQWSTQTLRRALEALETDDQRLRQGQTTCPPPLMSVQDWPVEGCDLIGFCSVDEPFESTVGEVEEGFARACFVADQTLGEPAACRWYINWYDDSPRDECFRETARVIREELIRRVPLRPDLKDAMERFPDDDVLRQAAFDWLLEQGASESEAALESGWRVQ